MMRNGLFISITAAVIWTAFLFNGASGAEARLADVRRIWDEAPHNAFTDLARFKGRWVCGFREAPAHAGGVEDSRIRVLVSRDGEEWSSATSLEDARGDIRDAKFAETPDGRLMLLTAIQNFDTSEYRHQSLAWFTEDLETWAGPFDVGERDFWLWGITWRDGVGYSIGYHTGSSRFARLYTTTDGLNFDVHVEDLEVDDPYPNESKIVFDAAGKAHCLLRGRNEAHLGTAEPPFTEWSWTKAGRFVGGPELIQLPNGRFIGGGRATDKDQGPAPRTELFEVDFRKGALETILALPSGGDTSYPGFVWSEGELWVSYYSSHEGKSSIYLARVEIGPEDTDERAPPNIVLVMADDQGWGDMAYNGHPHLKTPNFDAMAREAIRFDRFYAAAPVCSPTRASVLTGRTPVRSGVLMWGHALRPQETTIAQVLKSAGYRTGHFGKWHLGSVQTGGSATPGTFGFDEWVSSPNFFDLDPIFSERGKAVPFEGESSEVTVDLALEFIRRQAGEGSPFLAVVWFGSPHSPFEALDRDRDLYPEFPDNKRNFFGEITAMDRAFGRLRDELRELGVSDNTILWYCSDNGALPRVGSSGGHRGLKGSVYEGGLLVPALLEWPKGLDSGRTIAAPAVTSDIFPTLLELAGVANDQPRPLDGISLAPLLEDESGERPEPIGFWHYPAAGVRTPAREWMADLHAAQQNDLPDPDDPVRLAAGAEEIQVRMATDRFPGHAAWLRETLKLHRIENPDTGEVTWKLYDLSADPEESDNLIEEDRPRAEEMRTELERWLEEVARSHNGEDYR